MGNSGAARDSVMIADRGGLRIMRRRTLRCITLLATGAVHLFQALEHASALLGHTCTYWQRSLQPSEDWFTSRFTALGAISVLRQHACAAVRRPSVSLVLPNNSNSQSFRRRAPIVSSRYMHSFGRCEWLATYVSRPIPNAATTRRTTDRQSNEKAR